MLDSAVVAWLEALKERELDEPMRALLRARGFHDVHFVHGWSEFGRDFIAKRQENGVLRQYAVQSKAGDVGILDFRTARLQIDSIRTGDLSHPGFDSQLTRVAVLATTGRLVGDARTEAQAYRDKYAAEMTFEVWDQDRLVEFLVTRPEAALAGRDTGPLLRMLGMADADELTDVELERFSRRWVPSAGRLVEPADVLECAVLAGRVRVAERLDLACYTALCLLRAACAGAHGAERADDFAFASADSARRLFATFAAQLWERCDEQLLRPVPFVNIHSEFGFFATYSVRCSRVIELLGLYGIHQHEDSAEDATAVAEWLAEFIRQQPGAAHPLSDRYAVSLIPPTILLGSAHREMIEQWLREAVVWLTDRYHGALLGLGTTDADPETEVGYLLSALEHIDLPRRRESYLATVLLDLCCVLELSELYNDALNDVLAVDASPEVLHVPDTEAQFHRDGSGIDHEIGLHYPEPWEPTDGWRSASHHSVEARWLERHGRPWEALAISSALRDRHDIALVRRMIDTA